MTDPRQQLRRSLWIGALIALCIAVPVAFYDHVIDVRETRPQTDRFPVPLPLIVIASMLLGMGIGTQVTLFKANRHRLWTLLRPRPVRVIVALLMTLLAPVVQFWGIPGAYGLMLWSGVERLFDPATFAEWGSGGLVVLLFLYPVLIYPATCLTLGGIRRWFVKVAILGQVWLAFYGAVILFFGIYSGNM